MAALRCVLWIGRAEALEAAGLHRSPRVDLAWVRDVDEALELPLAGFDALLLDADGNDDPLDQAQRLQGSGPPLLVRLGEREADPQALRQAGACQVLPARLSGDALLSALDESAPPPARRAAVAEPTFPGIVTRSPAMTEVLALVERARHTRATVLISGETGTGKELLARAIHQGGPRAERAFVPINCAAFPDTLLESELFGHVKGAFTGAERDQKGLFETAAGGTLFLDEVGETSGPLQAKLLRALQEREVRPVGGTRARRVDVRVVAATNRELQAEVAAGRFREDLYYRLAVFPLRVPPLRERREDILPLARHFLALHGEREGHAGCRFSREAIHLLLSHAWPGNVRELENEVQRALALARPGAALTPSELSERVGAIAEPVAAGERDGEPLRATLQRIEALLIRRALARHGGRRAETARRLGITREGLYKKMQRLGIE